MIFSGLLLRCFPPLMALGLCGAALAACAADAPAPGVGVAAGCASSPVAELCARKAAHAGDAAPPPPERGRPLAQLRFEGGSLSFASADKRTAALGAALLFTCAAELVPEARAELEDPQRGVFLASEKEANRIAASVLRAERSVDIGWRLGREVVGAFDFSDSIWAVAEQRPPSSGSALSGELSARLQAERRLRDRSAAELIGGMAGAGLGGSIGRGWAGPRTPDFSSTALSSPAPPRRAVATAAAPLAAGGASRIALAAASGGLASSGRSAARAGAAIFAARASLSQSLAEPASVSGHAVNGRAALLSSAAVGGDAPHGIGDWQSRPWSRTRQVDWNRSVHLEVVGNYLITADRTLGGIKLDGVGDTWNREGIDIGRVIDLAPDPKKSHALTVGGIVSMGERRDVIQNGRVRALGENLDIHVIGGGPNSGGLEIAGSIVDGPLGKTGLVKTGGGELVLSSPIGDRGNQNSFTGAVYVKEGTLTLYKSSTSIDSSEIYVGGGLGEAVLNIKSAGDQINSEASVTLRGNEQGRAILRLERTQGNRGVSQTLRKLVVEGSGVIDFTNTHPGGGGASEKTKSILHIDELEIEGELTIRGWDKLNSQVIFDSQKPPDEATLAKITIEGWERIEVAKNKDGLWTLGPELGTEVTPEPATSGALISSAAIGLELWRRRRRRRRQQR